MNHPSAKSIVRAVVVIVIAAGAGAGGGGSAGCGGKPQLMTTPNLYAKNGVDPFPDVPAALQNNRVEVLYVTDRAYEKGATAEKPVYTYKRSRSVAFGVAEVEF